MVTKTAGARITGLLALTFEAQEDLSVGDPVSVTGDYEVSKYDGDKPFVGTVSVANVTREAGSGNFPVANTPGACTVETPGFFVEKVTASGEIAAGAFVVPDESDHPKYRELVELGLEEGDPNTFSGDHDRSIVGIALVGAAADDDEIDVVFFR